MDQFTGGCPTVSASATASTAASITAPSFTHPRSSRNRRWTSKARRAYGGRHFRPHCGSLVFAKSGEEIEVYLRALDKPDQFRPTYELWTVRRESWLPPFPLARHYEYDRPDGRTED